MQSQEKYHASLTELWISPSKYNCNHANYCDQKISKPYSRPNKEVNWLKREASQEVNKASHTKSGMLGKINYSNLYISHKNQKKKKTNCAITWIHIFIDEVVVINLPLLHCGDWNWSCVLSPIYHIPAEIKAVVVNLQSCSNNNLSMVILMNKKKSSIVTY